MSRSLPSGVLPLFIVESISPLFFQALLALPIIGGAAYYVLVARELSVRGGRVSLEYFGIPDLFMGSSLALYFGVNGILILFKSEAEAELRMEHIRSNFAFMLAVLILVVVFVNMRRVPLMRAFHLNWENFSAIPLRAALALGAALPPIWGVGFLWERFLQNSSPEQALVSLFRSSAESGDWSAVWLVTISAFIQAPVVEEVLFRGYFYVTLKRYMGAPISSLVVASLFAVCHGNIRVIPGLFVLSLCQTIMLERYGSLLVCIIMHACFNGLSLLLLYMESQGWLPH